MRLWVTRPRLDGEALAAKLRARGHSCIVEPLIEISLHPPPPSELRAADLIIATSRNALRSLQELHSNDLPVHTQLVVVGPGTAELAEDIGFGNVVVGSGQASELPRLIADKVAACGSMRPNIAILRGKDIAFDLAGALARLGISSREYLVYEALPTDAPSPELTAEIEAGRLDGVVLFSPRTAEIYALRMSERSLGAAMSQLGHFCLSENVADKLPQMHSVLAFVPAKPNVKEMINLFD